MTMTKKIQLKLKKEKRGVYTAQQDGEHIGFFKLPSDGLWRTTYFPETRLGQRTFGSMKMAKMVVEKELQEKHEWLKAQGYV